MIVCDGDLLFVLRRKRLLSLLNYALHHMPGGCCAKSVQISELGILFSAQRPLWSYISTTQ